MREWFSQIFAFIGTTSVTDIEWAGVNALNITTNVYNQAAYDELDKILAGRDSVSTMRDRLVGVFKAKGGEITAIPQAKTNIYLGDAL